MKKNTRYTKENIDISNENEAIYGKRQKPFLFNKREALTKKRYWIIWCKNGSF